MRCEACNALLNSHEIHLRDIHGKFVDMCTECLETIKDVYKVANDLDVIETLEDMGLEEK